MDTRRDFLKKASLLSAGSGLLHVLPASIAKALAIDPAAGSTFMDAEHIVLLMQENRSFDHTYGTLQGVRGFNDPRAIHLPNKNPVWLQSNKAGETYAPFRFDIKGTKVTWMSSLPHSWSDQVDARNNGKYDKWLDSKGSGNDAYEHMPLTMGYYTREDIPFYYSLADAFTVCDQHFCSSLTGTTPNRLYFWTGTIREKQEAAALANVWNEDADYDTMVNWTTFPERLEDNGISWKVYQNELSVGVGLPEEEDGWLANFGDNPLEYFTQYQVKLSAAYIANLPNAIARTTDAIQTKQKELATATDKKTNIERSIKWLQNKLVELTADQQNFTIEKYNGLSQREKNIHDKAFSTNKKDPHYHELTSLEYKDGDQIREMKIPKGDILHEFREDVKNKSLPTVSWVVAPASFSDHPGSAWYGAWYISEVMDILTKDPEVWKKTIFILTYDENDGYFDHVPPFVPPHPHKAGTGLTSKGIDTSVEYVTDNKQQSIQDRARESAIGLGYRVPMVVASPWSRGGWVNSEVLDHTSSLQFIEKFLFNKFGKQVKEENISEWRRTVCGDLTSVFRPYNGEKLVKPAFLDKAAFVESIHKAQFKNPPSNFKKLSATEIASVQQKGDHDLLPAQEKGIRSSNALPYELHVDGKLTADKKSFEIALACGNELFGKSAAGAPFVIYAPTLYNDETMRSWNYAVKAGDQIKDDWGIDHFSNGQYHLSAYGPNGFYREWTGDQADPDIDISLTYDQNTTKKSTGNIRLQLKNNTGKPATILVNNNAYSKTKQEHTIAAGTTKTILFDLGKSYGWYDFTVNLNGNKSFSKTYAGRVETGKPGKTDPLMGRAYS